MTLVLVPQKADMLSQSLLEAQLPVMLVDEPLADREDDRVYDLRDGKSEEPAAFHL